jgi:hypothetical protein
MRYEGLMIIANTNDTPVAAPMEIVDMIAFVLLDSMRDKEILRKYGF